jgi:hypothetical protein
MLHAKSVQHEPGAAVAGRDTCHILVAFVVGQSRCRDVGAIHHQDVIICDAWVVTERHVLCLRAASHHTSP